MDKNLVRRSMLLSPEQPWSQTRPEDLGPCIMKFMEDHEPYFQRWAEVWYTNMQFIYGNQSIRWSRRYGYAVDVDFLRTQPALNQRAQTNLSRVVAEALASLIYANLPEWIVDTASESSTKGKRFRRIIQNLLDAYMVRLCMDKEFSNAAMIFTALGQVAAYVDWNPHAGKLLEIPKWRKVKAPVFTDYMAPNAITQGQIEVPVQTLDSVGNPHFEDRWEAVVDSMGRQVIDKFFAGDVKVDILTPFEYRREIGSHGMHKTKYVQRIRILDYDEFLTEYAETPGRTKFFDKIQPVYNNPAIYKLAVRHFMRMQFTTPPQFNDLYRRGEGIYRNSMFKNKVLVTEHFDKPHPEKWKLGRKVVVVNGDCTNITTPTYQTNKMDGWHPFVEAQWLTVAPSSIAHGPMTDVVAKNREMNVADSLIATSLRRNMGSQLLIKTGMGLDPQRLTGEPGVTHEVTDILGARWLHDDMPIPPVISALREQYKTDVYETSGAMDALRGDRSKGVSSGYALRQLEEREQKRLTPAKKRFSMFVGGIGEKLVSCLKTNVTRLDDSVMGYLKRCAAGEFQPQDVIALLSSTVDYGIEIKIDEDSMAMRSKASEQATIQELGAEPALSNRLSSNAKVLDEYLKYFDVETLRDESAAHRDRAQRENELLTDMLRLGPDSAGLSWPIVLFEDDDKIHQAEHTEFLLQNSDEILRNEVFLQRLLLHIETHRLASQEKTGELLPGTSLQTGNMIAQSRKTPTPTVQTIYMKAEGDKMAQMQQPQPQAAPQGPPQAARSPAPPGSGGPKQTPTQAPSANTPGAKATVAKGGPQ